MTQFIPTRMQAMVFEKAGKPLRLREVAVPEPGPWDVLLKVNACGVCRTDLHVVDGDLTKPKQAVIPGHQIVGTVVAVGSQIPATEWLDAEVGVPWLGGSCGQCAFCNNGQENLCADAVYTGYQRDGGFAEYVSADSRYCFRLPEGYGHVQLAPLLCAGLIGYRAWRKACAVDGACDHIGFYGFGAAAHILMQVARHQGKRIYAFTRRDDDAAQAFALSLGATWAGGSDEASPERLDAAIIFAPDGALVPAALRQVRRGGRIVCAGIHMTDIPTFPYEDLWGERSIVSVANLTRRDGQDFLPLAARIPVKTDTHSYTLADTNRALDDLREGRFTGAAVIVP